MTKFEFLDKLKIALTGKVSATLVEENMTYYNEYIDSQIRMGKSEEEVMNMLGDPRLIARTIVQTNGTAGDSVEDASYRESASYSDSASYDGGNYSNGNYSNSNYSDNAYGNYSNGTYRSSYGNGSSNYSGKNNEVKVRSVPGWLVAVIAIIIVVCLLSFVFSIISALLPFVLPILIVLFLVKLFRDWLN